MARESIYGDQTEFTQADAPQIRQRAGIPPSDRAPTTAQREFQRPFNPVDRGAGGQYNSPFQAQAQRVREQTSANDPRADYYSIENQRDRLKAGQSITKRPEYNVLRRSMTMAPGMTQREIDSKVLGASVGLRGAEAAAAEAAMRQQLMAERMAIQANNASAGSRAYALVSGRAGEEDLLGQRERENARAARQAPGIQEQENASYGRQAELTQAPHMEAQRQATIAAQQGALKAFGASPEDIFTQNPATADIAERQRVLRREDNPPVYGGTGASYYEGPGSLQRLPRRQQKVGFLEGLTHDAVNAYNWFGGGDNGSLPGFFSGPDAFERYSVKGGGEVFSQPGLYTDAQRSAMPAVRRTPNGGYEPLTREPYGF